MFRKMFAVFALAMAGVAFAGQTTIDTSGLSDAQIAELKAIAAKKVADTAAQGSGMTSPKEVGTMVTLAATWGQQAAAAAEGFARALSLAARELGVTVNDFLQTDAGKLTAALIIWKVAGASIVGMFVGLGFIIAGQIVARVIYLRLFTQSYEKVEYSKFGGLFKGTKLIRIPKGFKDLHNDGEWLAFWVMLIASLGSMIVGAIIIV